MDKLDYLLGLGVTAIWVTPVYQNIEQFGTSEPYHYYWPQNFERIDRRLLDGTRLPNSTDMTTFAAFVDMCRAKGIKVVLDMVVNHAGYGADQLFDPSWFNVGGSGDIKGPAMRFAGLQPRQARGARVFHQQYRRLDHQRARSPTSAWTP